MELRVGMRVKGHYDASFYHHDNDGTYTGTVRHITRGSSAGTTCAGIQRDDGIGGAYGHYGLVYGSLWRVWEKSDGSWGGDGEKGMLKEIIRNTLPWEP